MEEDKMIDGALVIVGFDEEVDEMFVSIREDLPNEITIELLEEAIAYLKGERGEVNLQ